MKLNDYLNIWKILRSIDLWELDEAKVLVSKEQWINFRDNPTKFLCVTDDIIANGIWKIAITRHNKSKLKWRNTG